MNFKQLSSSKGEKYLTLKALKPVYYELGNFFLFYLFAFFTQFVFDSFVRLFQVYDYDWGLRDDFIGEASVDLRKLPENLAQDLLLTLVDSGQLNPGRLPAESGQLD